jgi:hypothetical protein
MAYCPAGACIDADQNGREAMLPPPPRGRFGLESSRGSRTGSLAGREAGIGQATYFNWKKRFDGLLPTEMRRLKQLEDENSKLRKLVADLSLDREMLQDVIRRKL